MKDLVARLPKAELHLHLEGTISPETLWAMAQANHVALPVGSLDELRGALRLRELRQVHRAVARHVLLPHAREADYERMVDGFVAECARQNIRYVEVHFTPYNHEKLRHRRPPRARRRDAPARSPPRRREGRWSGSSPTSRASRLPQSGPFTAALLEAGREPAGGGDRPGRPRGRASRARSSPPSSSGRATPATRRSPTPARPAGAEHVRQAVVDLKVRRVQHGVRAVEDPAVLRLLAEREICCDVALTSNECLKVVPSVWRPSAPDDCWRRACRSRSPPTTRRSSAPT